jgi:hypothetical protein
MMLILNDKTSAIFKTNVNTNEPVYGVFDSHQCLPNITAVGYYFKELNALSIKRVKLEHKTSQFFTRRTSESDIFCFELNKNHLS